MLRVGICSAALLVSFVVVFLSGCALTPVQATNKSCLSEIAADDASKIKIESYSVKLKTDATNLRLGPGTRYCVGLIETRKAKELSVTGSLVTWLRVELDGKVLWVHRSLVEKIT